MSRAVEVEGLSKLYRLGATDDRAGNFRELLTGMVAAPFRRLRQLQGAAGGSEEFWALRDVSFSIDRGEVVGIVGRNGAGKSTLLKVLSRIVEPTAGRVTMNGRVASLLEVGTGFHPELSGRENIYLNGSILGMRKREIDQRFDDIVQFAEVERFLDTPVKRYSSGMYVRLAFAVAAHLHPEILIVDEVLAVGDAEFQKKCLGKMKEVSEGGDRTVLFVSHNMAAVRTLCSRAIVLEKGRVTIDASADEAVKTYLAAFASGGTAEVEPKRPRDARFWIRRAVLMVEGEPAAEAHMGDQLTLVIDFGCSVPSRHPRFGFVVYSGTGESLLNSSNRFQPSPEFNPPTEHGRIRCELGSPPLLPGNYSISLWLGDPVGDYHIEYDALVFEVVPRDLWGQGQIPPASSPMWWPTKFEFQQARGSSAHSVE